MDVSTRYKTRRLWELLFAPARFERVRIDGSWNAVLEMQMVLMQAKRGFLYNRRIQPVPDPGTSSAEVSKQAGHWQFGAERECRGFRSTATI